MVKISLYRTCQKNICKSFYDCVGVHHCNHGLQRSFMFWIATLLLFTAAEPHLIVEFAICRMAVLFFLIFYESRWSHFVRKVVLLNNPYRHLLFPENKVFLKGKLSNLASIHSNHSILSVVRDNLNRTVTTKSKHSNQIKLKVCKINNTRYKYFKEMNQSTLFNKLLLPSVRIKAHSLKFGLLNKYNLTLTLKIKLKLNY